MAQEGRVVCCSSRNVLVLVVVGCKGAGMYIVAGCVVGVVPSCQTVSANKYNVGGTSSWYAELSWA